MSHDRGERASPLHLGERHCTSTGPKLSKTSSVHVPHPWRMCHFEGTDRSFPLGWAFPTSEYYARYDSPTAYGGRSRCQYCSASLARDASRRVGSSIVPS